MRSRKSDKTEQIDLLIKYHKLDKKAVKLLLFGLENSGITTFINTLCSIDKIKECNQQSLQLLHQNSVTTLIQLIDIAKKLGFSFDENLNTQIQILRNQMNGKMEFTAALINTIQRIWESKPLQETYQKLLSSPSLASSLPIPLVQAHYLFQNSSTSFDSNHTRVFNGLSETILRHNGVVFKLIDMRSQKGTYRKWISCFSEELDGIIFFASLLDYDVPSPSDPSITKLTQSLLYFQQITKDFEKIPSLLFLTKPDLIVKKVQECPLEKIFKGWSSLEGDYVENGIAHIKSLYADHFEGSRLYVVVASALDIENATRIFEIVRDAIIATATSFI